MWNTIKRYPIQALALLTNLGGFAWLQAEAGQLINTSKDFLTQHEGFIQSSTHYFRTNPIALLVLIIALLVIYHLIRTPLKLLLYAGNLLLLATLLGFIKF